MILRKKCILTLLFSSILILFLTLSKGNELTLIPKDDSLVPLNHNKYGPMNDGIIANTFFFLQIKGYSYKRSLNVCFYAIADNLAECFEDSSGQQMFDSKIHIFNQTKIKTLSLSIDDDFQHIENDQIDNKENDEVSNQENLSVLKEILEICAATSQRLFWCPLLLWLIGVQIWQYRRCFRFLIRRVRRMLLKDYRRRPRSIYIRPKHSLKASHGYLTISKSPIVDYGTSFALKFMNEKINTADLLSFTYQKF